MNAIETRGLTRYFGPTRAVSGLDFEVPQGHVVGLLGENGSGKTTTINLIVGALVPNEGTVRVLDVDPLEMEPSVRARIGYLADEVELPSWMKLREAMGVHSSYFQDWDGDRAWELIEKYQLDLDQPFGTLSKGQKRRFMLTLVIAQQPDLLVLDEPAGGLDVGVRRQFLDLLMELASEREITILISSHILSDVERVVDNVAFIKHGRLLRQAGIEDLKSGVKRLCLPKGFETDRLGDHFSILSTRAESDALLVVVDGFKPEKLDGIECRVEHLNLEELFLVHNQMAGGGNA